jgi:hypothetical protein
MCDYSLEHVASRAAVKNDRLVTTQFTNTITRGFASISDPTTAVCLLPGTEIVFDTAPKVDRFWFFSNRAASTRAARFRQINLHEARCHHDALEFADGTIVTLTRLKPGQGVTIVQLPRQQSSDMHDEGKKAPDVDRKIDLALVG